MAFAWVRRAVLASFLALGCSAADVVEPPRDAQVGSLRFDVEGGVLTAVPGESVTIRLLGSGLDKATIALEGNYVDASLNVGSVKLVDGVATFTMIAPSSAATFALKAKANDTIARLDVAVSANGFGVLRISSKYDGNRGTPIFTASVFVNASCGDLGKQDVDGSPVAVATQGETVVMPFVPAGGKLAVWVRIAHYAFGCKDVEDLVQGMTRDVSVIVYDQALDLLSTDLEARFTFAPTSNDKQIYDSIITAAAGTLLDGFSNSATLEPKRLLDAMAASTPTVSDQDAFTNVRTQQGWDATTASWFSGHTPSMRDRAQTWIDKGKPDTLADIDGHLGAGEAAQLTFAPKTFGLLDATRASLTVPAPFAASVYAPDVLHLDGTIDIHPTRLVATAADARAAIDVTTAKTVDEAIATGINCSGLSSMLVPSSYAYGTCDKACIANLCKLGVARMWNDAANQSSKAGQTLSLHLTASAPTNVGDYAEPVSFSGTWKGTFTDSASKQVATMLGIAKANHGAPPN